MDRGSISTLYQEVIDAIQSTQPDTHIIVFAIPPRNFDVKTSDIILLNHTLSQIPHKTQNVTYSKVTYSTFIYANQVKIDDFNKQDKHPLLHPTPQAKTRLGSIIQLTIPQKLIDLHHKPPKLINSTKHPLGLHLLVSLEAQLQLHNTTILHTYTMEKAIHFHDWEAACHIASTKDASLAQYWGDQCLTINQEYRDSWNRVNRMQNIFSTAIRHDKQLRSYVKDSKKRDILYMDSDNFCGVGKDFKGFNHIGMILMRLRHEFHR